MLKLFQEIISGQILFKDFWRKNIYTILYIFAGVFIMIVLSYYGDIKVAQISKQKKYIESLREKSLYYEATLMQMSLESKVYEQVKQRNLGLVKPNEPILIIKTYENESTR